MVVGGPTTVLDLGGLRIVSDPTFDAPGPHGYLTKTAGPAIGDDSIRAAAAAAILAPAAVIPAHYDGWATSAKGATISFAPSMTLAWARGSGSATTEPGFRSSPDAS